MSQKVVGILRGGKGDDYDMSVARGGDVFREIAENLGTRWKPVDILVDRQGNWHIGGVPVDPSKVVSRVDVVWNAGHPNFSETMKSFTVPSVGAGTFPHLLSRSRKILEDHMKNAGVRMPRSMALSLYQSDIDGTEDEYAKKRTREVFEKFSPPWIVRPLDPATMMGVHVAKTLGELESAIRDGVSHDAGMLVEELVPGRMTAVHSLAGFRGEDIYHLLPADPETGRPEGFSPEEKEFLLDLASRIYRHVGAEGYLKSNFLLSPTRGVLLTGIDIVPNFRPGSHLVRSLELVSARPHDVIEHLLEKAL